MPGSSVIVHVVQDLIVVHHVIVLLVVVVISKQSPAPAGVLVIDVVERHGRGNNTAVRIYNICVQGSDK